MLFASDCFLLSPSWMLVKNVADTNLIKIQRGLLPQRTFRTLARNSPRLREVMEQVICIKARDPRPNRAGIFRPLLLDRFQAGRYKFIIVISCQNLPFPAKLSGGTTRLIFRAPRSLESSSMFQVFRGPRLPTGPRLNWRRSSHLDLPLGFGSFHRTLLIL